VGLSDSVGVVGAFKTSRTALGGFRYGSAPNRTRAARSSRNEALDAVFIG